MLEEQGMDLEQRNVWAKHILKIKANNFSLWCLSGVPGGSDGKDYACKAGDLGSIPWVGKIPWRSVWQPTPEFLPRESHGQRSLAGYSPWVCKESDMTE